MPKTVMGSVFGVAFNRRGAGSAKGSAEFLQRLTERRTHGIIEMSVALSLHRSERVPKGRRTAMDFREKIIRYRDEKGLSQQELADLLQVSRQTVSRWESGKSRPQPGQAANICAMLRIDTQGSDLAENPPPMQEAPRAAEEREDADKDTEIGFFRSARARIAALVAIAVLLLAAVGGLVLTIVYAVRDSLYDASATVWIIAIPQNTPMLVLSVFLAVFIAMLVALFVILLRGKRK